MKKLKPETLGEVLRKGRYMCGLSQAEVAQKLGHSSSQFLSNIERNISRPPIKEIRAYAKAYGVDATLIVDLMFRERIAALEAERQRLISRLASRRKEKRNVDV